MIHVITRANNRQQIFHNQFDFRRFLKTVARVIEEHEIFVHHYALMHNHVHMLLWVPDTQALAPAMKAIQVSYQIYYAKKYDYQGHLWHSRYRSIIVQSEEQMLQCARYIELNPVHAKICELLSEYRWTSYPYYALGQRDPIIRPVIAIPEVPRWECGKQQRDYQKFIHAGVDHEYRQLKKEFEAQH